MQSATIGTIKTYMWKNSNPKPLDTVNGKSDLDDGTKLQIVDAFTNCAEIYGTTLGLLIFFAILYITLECFSQGELEINCTLPMNVFHFLSLAAILFVVLFIVLPTDDRYSTFYLIPPGLRLFVTASHYESRPSPSLKRNLPRVVRSFLPEGRYWLDQRKKPIYPAVHADLETFCAYNRDNEKCDNTSMIVPKKKIKNPPNVVFFIYESLNPYTYLINEDFLDEHVLAPEKKLVTDTPFYKKTVMPEIAEIAKDGVTFSGLASHGLPTFSGFHALLTGTIPSQSLMNIASLKELHSDDFLPIVRQFGYRTLGLFGTPPEFDGFSNWFNRRPAREEAMRRLRCSQASDLFDDPLQIALNGQPSELNLCTEEEIEKMARKISFDPPKWFDYHQFYYPTNKQFQILGADPEKTREIWIPDRILAHQFQYHYKQQKEFLERKNEKKPIFSMLLTTDAHIPYFGFDAKKFYDGDNKTDLISRFNRANRYTDKHIGKMIKFLRQHDNNTIVVLTGDHGTRDIPIRAKEAHVTKNAVFSGDCIHTPTGSDSLFVSSGLISYLGDDEEVKEMLKLDKVKGKVFKAPTDHTDLVYTLLDVLSNMTGNRNPPSSRRSRNLIDLTSDSIDKIAEDGNDERAWSDIDKTRWQSISHVSAQAEYKNGTKMLRIHPNYVRVAHFYDKASFPTCLKAKGEPDMKTVKKLDMVFDFHKKLSAENYLVAHNRLYNFNFHDQKCVDKGKCFFHEPEEIEYSDFLDLMVAWCIPPLFCIVVILPFEYLILSMFCQTSPKRAVGSEEEEELIHGEKKLLDTIDDAFEEDDLIFEKNHLYDY